MSAALIVIEVAAPQVSEDALSVLVSACSRVARDATCVLTKDTSEEQPSAVAIVSLPAEDKMRVEVGLRQSGHDSWRTKDFTFQPEDDILDRWRAVGFAIGTLAESNPPPAQDTGHAVERAAPPAATRPVPVAAVPKQAKPRPTRQLFIGASAIFGPGLDRGRWRLGSALYADWAPPLRLPHFFTVGASAATTLGAASSGTSREGASTTTTRWFDLSAGAGVPIVGPLLGSGLEFRTAVLTEYLRVSASAFDRSENRSRWTFGVQGAFVGRLRIASGLFLTAELQAAGFSGATVIRVGSESIGTASAFRYLGSVGLRVRLR